MRTGSIVKTLIDVQDDAGKHQSAGTKARVLVHRIRDGAEFVQVEFGNQCVFVRGRAVLLVSEVEEV